jgi:hypothetical protein
MTATLVLRSNNASNPLVLDLSQFLDLTPDSDMDPQNPSFSSKVISHSLLREGGILALEAWQEKELVFPVKLNASTNVALQQLIQQINQVVTNPGSTYHWTPPGASQATVFDAISGEFDVKYKYREDEKQWCTGDLKLFTQPFGRTAGPRPYASASSVGPLLLITPYGSTGQNIIGASTQAGVSGFGCAPTGPSSGVFYWGSPSLAGDAPAQLQITVAQNPSPGTPSPLTSLSGFTAPFAAPLAAVGVLPDANYRVLHPVPDWNEFGTVASTVLFVNDQSAVGSQYVSCRAIASAQTFIVPIASTTELRPTAQWVGQHRLFAIARASQQAASLQLLDSPMANPIGQAVVFPGTWQLVDLGTIAYAASGPAQPNPNIAVQAFPGPSSAVDITAFATLPDANTWFINPTPNINNGDLTNALNTWAFNVLTQPSTFGAGYSLDDVTGHHYLLPYTSTNTAPSPAQAAGTFEVTAFSRGLVPRPDPKNGVPVIAILAVGQASSGAIGIGASNPQVRRLTAQVNVLERARYVMP